jgi:hypothetical protein
MFSLGTAPGFADALDTWTKENSGVGANLTGIAYGPNRFVAVGQSGLMLVSSNASHWTPTPSGTTSNLLGITHAAGTFVAVGNGGIIRRSTNGLDWVTAASPTTNTLSGIGFGNGLFVAVGNIGTILTSPDGSTWTARGSGTTRNLMGAAYGNGMFMVVGKGMSNPGTVLTSTDGINWLDRTYPQLGVGFQTVAQGAGVFVAMDARGIAFTSGTGTNWTSRFTTVGGSYVYGLTCAQGLFVGAGGPTLTSGQAITTSPDGFAWRERSVYVTNSATLRAVTYGNGCFVAVGDKGMVLKSGPVFTLRPSGMNGANAELTLAGESGRVYRIQESTNLATGWQDWLTITNTSELMPVPTPIFPGDIRLFRAVTP